MGKQSIINNKEVALVFLQNRYFYLSQGLNLYVSLHKVRYESMVLFCGLKFKYLVEDLVWIGCTSSRAKSQIKYDHELIDWFVVVVLNLWKPKIKKVVCAYCICEWMLAMDFENQSVVLFPILKNPGIDCYINNPNLLWIFHSSQVWVCHKYGKIYLQNKTWDFTKTENNIFKTNW